MKIGQRIKNQRKSMGLTQKQFGIIFGLAPQTISDIENDKKKPSKTTIEYAKFRFGENFGLIYDKPSEIINSKNQMKISKDSEKGSYGIPDLTNYKVKKIIEGEAIQTIEQIDPALSGLKQILDSRDPIFISAIQANIRAFVLAVQRGKINNQQAARIKVLEDKCKSLKKRLERIEVKCPQCPIKGPAGGPARKMEM